MIVRSGFILRETYSWTEYGPSQVSESFEIGMVSFYGLDIHRQMVRIIPMMILGKGWVFPTIGPPPTFDLLWLASALSQHWWVYHQYASILQ